MAHHPTPPFWNTTLQDVIIDKPNVITNVTIVFLTIVCTTTIIVNAVTAIVILIDRTLRQQNHYMLLLNLSILGLLVGVVAVPKDIVLYVHRPAPWLCQLSTGVSIMFTLSVIGSTALLSLHKYVHIFYPLIYTTLVTTKRVGVAITAIWLLPIVIFLTVSVVAMANGEGFFNSVPGCEGYKPALVVVIVPTVFFITGVCIVLFTNIRIACLVREKRRHIRALTLETAVAGTEASQSTRPVALSKREVNVAITLFVILTTWIIFWTPVFVVIVLSVLYPNGSHGNALFWTTQLSYSFSTLCPFIYAFDKPFRVACNKYVFRKREVQSLQHIDTTRVTRRP
ncbi:histamine H2 receptor-like [Saccoglossus kowalevskii]|uniref:Dopamine receptor 1-like n=1 Tax=Saccoglossus kowalevskii TaxID=10224 RepID=A0ABM0M8Q7_SACKO|nr:PREDICTED: dopamine receptor 1-like [Saccoglossus kowalevskii]